MKWYVAYRFTGEDSKILEETMKKICEFLQINDHSNYCSFFDPKMFDIGNKKVFEKAFNKIDNSDALLVFVRSEDKSEGMLMEIGYAIAKNKRIVLAIQKDVKNTHLREVIKEFIEFEDLDELKEKLGSLK